MDARQVRYFLAVVDHGGVGRAAAALHIAQPSISQSLRALERELGVELFDRVGRGLRLSSAGAAFLGPAREIEADRDRAVAAVHNVRSLAGGELDIAVTEDLALDPMVELITRFRAAHPQVRVAVRSAAESELAARLVRDAGCELALCSLPAPAPGLVSVELATRELVLAVPPGGPDPGDDPVPLARLADLPLVGGPVGDAVRTRLRTLGVRHQIAVETNLQTAVHQLVLHGAGAGILPAAVAADLARQGVRVRSLDPPLLLPVGMVHRADSLSAISTAFLRIATEAGQQGSIP